ncbi:hypothetical protein TVAG_387850 [Trichomonas vaginalis G3]|uniref:Uncharacterized protein n=1 Tax=Trichomonas vaginalis (strain ATCC PRA-98 / G3) TaxID=412133 RepID=A2E112_TRIV3|nr:ankyrin repeat-containing family [Trichomonas vaginalis G3]EAY13644.1 hypothetical protein TVAG_387850 [Trichomonas vaginalis G3]KAI5529918.1 ankyrin repeat-containing family [Trichomonas vaginalis G3]|eukprot:XP_001325867.1 hypothetical protein [Trichomonas vaginalis G3]
MLNTTIKSSPINTKETFTEDEFMRAIKNKDILKVRDILDTNYDPNKACESSKCHPLEICEDFEIFKLLIERGINFMQKYTDDKEKTQIPVFKIVSRRNKQFFDFLIEKGLDIKINNEVNQSTLDHYAAKNPDVGIMNYLIKKKMNYKNSENSKGDLPIHIACKHSNTEVIKALIDKRCQISKENKNGEISLHFAVKFGTPEIVKLLLENKSQFGVLDKFGNAPIHYIFESKSPIEMIKKFVECLCKESNNVRLIIDIQTNENLTLLCKSCINNKVEIAKYLIEIGSDVNYQMPNGDTPLILAIKYGSDTNTDIIDLLLKKDADVNHVNSKGDFPLKLVKSIQHFNALIKYKPHLNNNSCDLMDHHFFSKHIDVANELGKILKDYNYYNCFQKAIDMKNVEFVEMLAKFGANVNSQDILGMSPFQYAVCSGQSEIVKLLIKLGADLEHEDIEGNTAFLLAAKYSAVSDEILDLLDEKCDILHANHSGHSAFYIAAEYKNEHFLKHFYNKKPDLLKRMAKDKGNDLYTVKLICNKNKYPYLLKYFGIPPFPFEPPIVILQDKLKDKDKYGDSDILCAIRNRYYTAFIHFYNESNPKPDLNQTNKFGEFPLFVACYQDFSWRFIDYRSAIFPNERGG